MHPLNFFDKSIHSIDRLWKIMINDENQTTILSLLKLQQELKKEQAKEERERESVSRK